MPAILKNLMQEFLDQHLLKDPIQAIGFGCWAVVRDQCEVDVWEARFQFADGVHGRFVVGVGPDEEVKAVVTNGRDVVGDHLPDHGLLLPKGTEDGDGSFRVDGSFRLWGSA